MSNGTTVTPAYGQSQIVPEDAIAAWGTRMIVTQDGHVDFLWDRQGSDEGEHSEELLDRLTKHFNVIALRDTVRELLIDGDMMTREAEDFTLYMDDRMVVNANTNASAGYCYVTAWLYPKVRNLAHFTTEDAEAIIGRRLTEGEYRALVKTLEHSSMGEVFAECVAAVIE